MPEWRAPRARGEIAGSARAGITESGGHDGDEPIVVKLLRRELQPVTQRIARRVVPGNTGFVYAAPRRLADEQQPRVGASTQDRIGRGGQMGGAHLTSADFSQQRS